VDEWGVWDRMDPDEEKKYGRLFQQITMRGAVAAAMASTCSTGRRTASSCRTSRRMVNVLHSLLLTDEDKCVRTTTYYTYELMKGHRGKQSVKVETGDASPLGLSVSASKAGGEAVVTFANPRHDTGQNVTCGFTGGVAGSASAQVLHHADLNAFNGFLNPDAVVPKGLAVTVERGGLKMALPPLSVATVTVKLA